MMVHTVITAFFDHQLQQLCTCVPSALCSHKLSIQIVIRIDNLCEHEALTRKMHKEWCGDILMNYKLKVAWQANLQLQFMKKVVQRKLEVVGNHLI